MLNQVPVPKKSNQSHSTNTGTHMQVPCLHINFRDVYLTKEKQFNTFHNFFQQKILFFIIKNA